MNSIAPQAGSSTEPGHERAPFHGVEVVTLGADTLRASVTVTGTLDASNVGLLTCVLGTHITAGRRYLRLDLGGAELIDAAADAAMVASLVPIHDAVAGLGGMLAVENLGPRTDAAARAAALYVNTPG